MILGILLPKRSTVPFLLPDATSALIRPKPSTFSSDFKNTLKFPEREVYFCYILNEEVLSVSLRSSTPRGLSKKYHFILPNAP